MHRILGYIQKVLIPALHPTRAYNGDRIRFGRFDSVRMKDNATMLLGVPRIRQLRVVNGTKQELQLLFKTKHNSQRT